MRSNPEKHFGIWYCIDTSGISDLAGLEDWITPYLGCLDCAPLLNPTRPLICLLSSISSLKSIKIRPLVRYPRLGGPCSQISCPFPPVVSGRTSQPSHLLASSGFFPLEMSVFYWGKRGEGLFPLFPLLSIEHYQAWTSQHFVCEIASISGAALLLAPPSTAQSIPAVPPITHTPAAILETPPPPFKLILHRDILITHTTPQTKQRKRNKFRGSRTPA